MALRSAFLNDLLSRIPEDQRAGVEAALAPDEIQNFADQGASRQQDYSRKMDDIRLKAQQIETERAAINQRAQDQREWYEANLPILEAGRQAVAGGVVTPPVTPPTPPAVTLPADLMRKAEVEALVNNREAGAVAFFAAVNHLSLQHYQRFGEVLDIAALTSDPDAGKLGINAVYQKQHAEKIAAAAATAEDKRINDIVATRLAEERRKSGDRPPYPVAGSEVSPLDVLSQAPGDPTRFSVDAAADEYARLVAARG